MYQRQKRKEVEPSTEDEELDVVEAFKSCHISSKTGLTNEVQHAVVLTKDSSMSNTFLKNAGLQSGCSSKSASSTERDLREQLEAERRAKAALEEQLATLKKKSEVTEENLAKAQRQLDETTKTAEEI